MDQSKEIGIPSAGGVRLAATLFAPSDEQNNHCAVVIVSAMAVPRHYYKKYASFLAQHGFTVVTFDYRGMCDSSLNDLNPRQVLMRDWGKYDISAVISWLKTASNPKKLLVVAQSAGGQLIGLTPNNYLIDGMIAVTAQSGYWGHWSGQEKRHLWVLWHVLIPTLSRLLPYFPAKLLGLGENIPSGVARQWAKWGRHPDYMLSDPEPNYFAQLKAPMLFYSFDDDPRFAPKASVQALTQFYKQAPIEWRHLEPSQLNVKNIGHFGFFKEQFRGSLWQESLEWLKRNSV